MNSIDTLSSLQASFWNVWQGVVNVVPLIILAIIILIVGWIIGAAISKVIEQVVRSLKVDKALSHAGLDELVGRGGFDLNTGKFLGEIVKWFVIIIALITAFDVLGLQQVNNFLTGVVVAYIPQVIAAVLILLISVVLADALQRVVVASAKAARIGSANFLGSVTKWAIWIFAALAALFQLGIGAVFIQTLFTGIIVALALAFGLSFGLGGRDAAAGFLSKVRGEMSGKD